MPATTHNRFVPKTPRLATGRAQVTPSRVAPASDPRVKLQHATVTGLQERRRRRRVAVMPMYSSAVVRVLSQKGLLIEGHILDVSENGLAVELDSLIAVGQAVTVEFRISGLGRVVEGEWSEMAAAGEIVRQENLDDFPGGPYKHAIRFARMSTMAQAQIARFVATHAG
ncbi:MAG TPA: PilZ domain-containing protein [Phycisphaerae bacterium]|nr:PilZ domain-containing protein [Phycisphaerae bacterium]